MIYALTRPHSCCGDRVLCLFEGPEGVPWTEIVDAALARERQPWMDEDDWKHSVALSDFVFDGETRDRILAAAAPHGVSLLPFAYVHLFRFQPTDADAATVEPYEPRTP